MDLLVAELKRIQGQQEQLRAAVAQNRVLVVHPPKGFHADSVEDEYAEEKEVKPDPDRFIPSGDPPCRVVSTHAEYIYGVCVGAASLNRVHLHLKGCVCQASDSNL